MLFIKSTLKRLGKKIKRNGRRVFNCIKIWILTLIPLKMRWTLSIKKYVEWSTQTLPPDYLRQIQNEGHEFAKFIGQPKLCLDIGCGNGLIGGRSYEKMGYKYLHRNSESFIVGIDPLPLVGPKPPWLEEYVMAMCEYLPFRNSFDKGVMATSLDHFLNPLKCFEELSAIPLLFIWASFFKNKTAGDIHHPYRLTKEELNDLLKTAGFNITQLRVIENSSSATSLFIEATNFRGNK